MEHDFKEGDVVRLKSGGPEMTIQGIGRYGPAAKKDNALCVWFDGKKHFEEIFELHTLAVKKTSVARDALMKKLGV